MSSVRRRLATKHHNNSRNVQLALEPRQFSSLSCNKGVGVRGAVMDVKPLHAFVIVVFFMLLVGLAAYSGTQARIIQGPSDLRIDREGQLHVRIGQGIFVYDEFLRLTDNYSLDRFGFDGLLGNFDFFADNSLLLAADRVQSASDADSGRLLRCSFNSASCQPLSSATHRFSTSFRVHIDAGDDIFLADTASDAVYQLDRQGRELEKFPGKLQRPNQLLRTGDQLVIANTDGMELVVVPLVNGSFAAADEWQHIALDSEVNRSRRERRPIDFLRADDGWIILAKHKDMRSGAIYRYSEAGEYQSHFELPAGADPFALAYFGNSIVVADYANLRIYRYDSEGRSQGELDSPAQADYIAQLQQRQVKFRVLEYTSWGVFALALITGFIVAVRGELKKAKRKLLEKELREEASGPAGPTARPHPMDARIHWLSPKKTALWLALLGVGLTLAMPLLIGMGIPETDDPKKICSRYTLNLMVWGFTGMMLLIFIPLLMKMRGMMRMRIGVCDEWVLVDHGNGTVRIAADKDLIKVGNGFIVDGITIATGNPQMTLYDRKELEKWLQPRLDRCSTLGPIQQLSWQWQHRRGLFVLSAAAVVAGLALIVAMESGWLEGRLERWVKTRPACWDASGSGDPAQGVPGQAEIEVPGQINFELDPQIDR